MTPIDDADPAPVQAPQPVASAPAPGSAAAQRPTVRFLLAHPAHLIALGFGSGLAPFAPGTFGTAWAWATYVLAERFLAPVPWGWVLLAGTAVGLWACTRCQQHMGQPRLHQRRVRKHVVQRHHQPAQHACQGALAVPLGLMWVT